MPEDVEMPAPVYAIQLRERLISRAINATLACKTCLCGVHVWAVRGGGSVGVHGVVVRGVVVVVIVVEGNVSVPLPNQCTRELSSTRSLAWPPYNSILSLLGMTIAGDPSNHAFPRASPQGLLRG